MRRPSPDALDLAAEWAEAYEDAVDAATLTHVAAWLRQQAQKGRLADFVRRAVRETGCTRARAVRAYRESFKK